MVIQSYAAPHLQKFEHFEHLWPHTDFSKTSISQDEIRSIGIERDQIAPYYPEGYFYPVSVPGLSGTSPHYAIRYTDTATTNVYLPDEQQVIAIEINGVAHAYPLLLLNNHEIVNTQISGVPILVTFCPLCNSSIVYRREVNGRVLHFGVSGLLRNSNLIMWDHETETLWQQFTGEGIVGKMTGVQLEFLPSLVVSWGEFRQEYPDGLVMANMAGHEPDTVSYEEYDELGNPFLFDGEVDPRLLPTTRVLGYRGIEGAVAYPFDVLAQAVVVNDETGGEPVVVFWQPGANSLFTSDIEIGSAGLFSARLEDSTPLTFVAENDLIRDEQTGSTWNVFGCAVEGKLAGTQLRQLFAYQHFWFAWAAFHPHTLIWEPGITTDEAWMLNQ